MKIKIAHLYYDLMNLYGESGNVAALKKHLENSNIDVEIHFFTIEDVIDFKGFDIYYIGSGSDDNQELVINDILKYKQAIKVAIENNKCFIATGNAIEIFGKHIKNLDNNKKECLGIFDFYTHKTDFRIVGEQLYKTKLIDKLIIGFQNRNGVIKNHYNEFFDVIDGTGYEPNNHQEGFIYKKFYGTYLFGPLLIRNPYLTDYILKDITKLKKIKYKEFINTYEYKAYEEFIKNIKKEKTHV